MKNELTVGSLFSGVGGIEIGFEKEGFKTEWFIEKEPYAKAVLKKRFPGTIIYGDVTKINFRTVPKVDVLTGGFPCQDISVAGKQIGIKGSRSSLWKYYAKAIRILRPKFALIENVSALAIRGLNVVLSDLAKIGYDAEWYNLSASAVGAFHQRERIFIITYPNRNRKSNESFNEGEGQRFVDEVSNANIRQCNRTKKEICSGRNTIDLSSEDVSNSNDQGQERGGQDEIRHEEFSNTSGFGCNDGGNNWKERHIQDAEEWGVEEDKSEGDRWKHRSSEICQDISNSKCLRPSEQGKPRRPLYSEKNEDWKTSRFNDDSIWRVEPELGRVADGIPNRVDRIKCLGNAVVPQCAEVFAKAIKMKLNSQTD